MNRRQQLLDFLTENQGLYVSGEALAKRLGCSRAAVWKNIAALRAEGHSILAVTNHGYCMSLPGEAFCRNVQKKLSDANLDQLFDLHVREMTDSTNSDARKAGDQGVREFSVFVAMSQTGGRGRRGRTFFSDNRDGLWFSILLRPTLDLRAASSVTLLFGLIVLRAVEELCHIPVGLKWPNDIISLQNGKKVCGILSETSMEENRISYAVVGCGLNLSQSSFPEEIQDVATSVLLLGAQIEKEEILFRILKETAERYPAFIQDPTSFLTEYRANCVTLGRRVRVESNPPFEGLAEGVSSLGDLLVRTDDGVLRTCTSGEVSIRSGKCQE